MMEIFLTLLLVQQSQGSEAMQVSRLQGKCMQAALGMHRCTPSLFQMTVPCWAMI